jgi:tetratricopeptide (TPR) repeat protein
MRQIVIFFISVFTFFVGCSPKIVESKKSEEVVKVEPEKKEPLSPCAGFNELSGENRGNAETAFVLYRDYLKTKNYKEALAQWRIAYSLAPGSNGRVKYHFEDGATIYKYLFDNTTDKNLKAMYVDTIMMIYDKRKECFGDEAYINGLKAFDYYYLFSSYTTEAKVYELFRSNFDVKGKNADYFVINPFTKVLYDGVVAGTISQDEGRKYTKLIFEAINQGLSTCKGTACDSWNIINEYSPVILEGLEGIDGFYDCNYYAEKYYNLFTAYPDSCEIINLAYARMLRGNCLETDARLKEVKDAKAKKCYEAPPALSCAAQGNESYGQGRYSKAIESYLDCVENSSDNEQKAKFLILIAKIYYRDLKNYPKSRKFALDAAKLKPSWGEPFMLIGNLYASSGPLCGPGRGWESQVVTWPAIDMWTKAKNVEPRLTNEANQLINRYKQYMPKKEDIFFRSVKAGDPYFVPCWIQESTTIRTAD